VQDRSGMKGPVGVAEQFAGQKDEICLTGADDLVGLGWLGDHPDGGGWYRCLAADGVGVMHLIARAYGNLLGGVIAACRNVYEINVCLSKKL